jgi:hypothetical protein
MPSLNRDCSAILVVFFVFLMWPLSSRASLASTEEQLSYAREILPEMLKKHHLTLTPNSMSLKPSHHVVKLAGDALESITSWFIPTRESDFQVLTFRATDMEGDPFNGWTYLFTADEKAYCSKGQNCDWLRRHASARRIVTSIHNEPVYMRLIGDAQGPLEAISEEGDSAYSLHVTPQCHFRANGTCHWNSHPY